MEHSNPPVLNAIYDKGRAASEAGDPRISPYDANTSGKRWRTYAHAWLAGWDDVADEAEED